jgi:hypothetical protein
MKILAILGGLPGLQDPIYSLKISKQANRVIARYNQLRLPIALVSCVNGQLLEVSGSRKLCVKVWNDM